MKEITRGDYFSLNYFDNFPYDLFTGIKVKRESSIALKGESKDVIKLAPGESRELANIRGAGVISRIWISAISKDTYFLHNSLLKIFWNDQEIPCVETPLGDFFGVGFGKFSPHTSAFIGMEGGACYSYFPMPFENSVKIVFMNQSTRSVEAMAYEIDYCLIPFEQKEILKRFGCFHAKWSCEHETNLLNDFTVLRAKGSGVYLGSMLAIEFQGFSGEPYEGDEKIYFNGEEEPSYQGTGTNAFLNGGYIFPERMDNGYYSRVSYMDWKQGILCGYRFYTKAPMAFSDGIEVAFEHGDRNRIKANFSSVAYWYQMEPHINVESWSTDSYQPAIDSLSQIKGGAIEGELMLPPLYSSGDDFNEEITTLREGKWSDNAFLCFKGDNQGDFIVLNLPCVGLVEGNYKIFIAYTCGQDFGIFNIFIDNKLFIKGIDGFSEEFSNSGTVELGTFYLDSGNHKLKLEVAGKNPEARRYYIGLDFINLVQEKKQGEIS